MTAFPTCAVGEFAPTAPALMAGAGAAVLILFDEDATLATLVETIWDNRPGGRTPAHVSLKVFDEHATPTFAAYVDLIPR